MDLTIIKLGGSFITHKKTPYTINLPAIRSAARQIAHCLQTGNIKKLILVHGVGSFGHPPVLKNKLHLGFKEKAQLMAMTQTQFEVNNLRMRLMEELMTAGIPAFLTHSSSLFTSEKQIIQNSFLGGITGYLKLGMVPVIGGDMLADTTMGFSVGSGDQITVFLAEKLHAGRIIFVSDVNGIFTADPKVHPGSSVIPQINIGNMAAVLERLEEKHPKDASGGMAGKLKALAHIKPLLEKGTKVHLLSMKDTGLLTRLVEGRGSPGTELIIN